MSRGRENFAKRSVTDYIDLTGDDDNIPSPRKKKQPRLEPQHQQRATQSPSWPARSFVIEDDDSDDLDNELMFIGSNAIHYDDGPVELYGILSSKVVGIQYYNGIASTGETVRIQREPQNKYDRNAIRVLNMFGAQIGHIPRQIASKLATYLDEGSLTVDARLRGGGNSFEAPIELSVFGPSNREQRSQLATRLKRDGISLKQLEATEREMDIRRREEIARAITSSSFSEHGMPVPGYGAGSSQSSYRAMEDIISMSGREMNPIEIGRYAEKFGMSEEDLERLPKADFPKRLVTRLLPYQQQGLAWLQDRENPTLPEAGTGEAVQLWKLNEDGIYENIATMMKTRSTPKLASGGILADDMGLGKTIQIISLIISDLEDSAKKGARTTLVVAPLSLLSNWSNQIAQHVDPRKPLRVFTYHGTSKKKVFKPDQFAQYDVVLTTYGAVSTEYDPKTTKDKDEYKTKTGIFSNEWRRVVLDEGHIIRNSSTRVSQACRQVRASSRWCLTGTPIVNNLNDLCSVLAFVGITGGLESEHIFTSIIGRPVKQREPIAIALLQAVMAQFTLRRKKDFAYINLKLPKITHRILDVEFSKKERDIHDTFKVTARSDLEDWRMLREGDREERRQAREAYRHLFEVLLRMRQTCNHWKLCGERATEIMQLLADKKNVDLTPENVEALKDLMKLAVEGSDDCPVCMDAITLARTPAITTCGHIFCKNDILQVIQAQKKCPMCRQPLLDERSIVELTAADYDKEDNLLENQDENEEPDEQDSSKLKALMELLRSKQDEDDPKVVLFSQWTSFLSLLEPHLREAGLKYTRLDGTMNVAKRDAALRQFDKDPECTIMLASLAVASVGLNLVVANTVILVDSWWAPSIEDQAVDRIYRLGQKRECSVFKLVVKESIEQRVLEIQQDKRALMRAAFNETEDGNPRQREENRFRDIARLLA